MIFSKGILTITVSYQLGKFVSYCCSRLYGSRDPDSQSRECFTRNTHLKLHILPGYLVLLVPKKNNHTGRSN